MMSLLYSVFWLLSHMWLFDQLHISILPRNKMRRFSQDIEKVKFLTLVICKLGADLALGFIELSDFLRG